MTKETTEKHKQKSILHEVYVFSEWKPEPEFIQKPEHFIPLKIKALWSWMKFIQPQKGVVESIAFHKIHQQKWQIALGDEGKVLAVLTDNILEIRTRRSEYATIAARTTVPRDANPQWRKLVWSPDCSFLAVTHSTGSVTFYDLTATSLFSIPSDCSRPGGLECSDTTHALAAVIFMPLRIKDVKWSWEALLVTHEGGLRAYMVSPVLGAELHHTHAFPGGVTAICYSHVHNLLVVASLPHSLSKSASPALQCGLTAWRILSDAPFYKLSVASDGLDAAAARSLQRYLPFGARKDVNFVVRMSVSGDASKLVCAHGTGELSVWRLPLLRALHRWPLDAQPASAARSPLGAAPPGMAAVPVDVTWWSNLEVIVSRFSGALTICPVDTMENILGEEPEFLQGAPQITSAFENTFMALECESKILQAHKSDSEENVAVSRGGESEELSLYEGGVELLKLLLYAVTELEAFQPRPRRLTVVARCYRLLGLRSTTPHDLFARKIENGQYEEALVLARTYELDADLVYQQQWRKAHVSTDAINNYLAKVSKTVWVVHQCVDRLPETLVAARDLLKFGLALTNREILREINKDREKDFIEDVEDIGVEDLSVAGSELLRCRHVMLFYADRLTVYEEILRCEKSTYDREEYHRIRSTSIFHSALELAKEGRVEALKCLWPQIGPVTQKTMVLGHLPETMNPLDYQILLPSLADAVPWTGAGKLQETSDWCRKEIFRSIWDSDWSEEPAPSPDLSAADLEKLVSEWYEQRAREIERYSGMVSNAITLVNLAVDRGWRGLDDVAFHLLTLDTLLYDAGVEGVALHALEQMSPLDVCCLLAPHPGGDICKALKEFILPYLKRWEQHTKQAGVATLGLADYLARLCEDDLAPLLTVLRSAKEFNLSVSDQLELAEKCLLSHRRTDQLDIACDALACILKETEESIGAESAAQLERLARLERLVRASGEAARHGVQAPLPDLAAISRSEQRAAAMLRKMARALPTRDEKPQESDWKALLKGLLTLQENLFTCVSKELCYEIYASALLTSGNAATIKMAAGVMCCEAGGGAGAGPRCLVPYARAVDLVLGAAREYFNSASSLRDPALEMSRCCLNLIKEENPLIQEELDLITALPILASFGLSILPIQVRLCEDRMSLIGECLSGSADAYLAHHRLLKLACLLRVAADDDQKREGVVLSAVVASALEAGAGGAATAAECARRLAAARHAPAAPLLARAARATPHRDLRRHLLAAAAAHAHPDALPHLLTDRLALELEDLEQELADKMEARREHFPSLQEKLDSTDEDFTDALTTPVIDQKDLVESPATAKITSFNNSVETWLSKLCRGLADGREHLLKDPDTEVPESVHVQEFYRSLYPKFLGTDRAYRFDRFSLPDPGTSVSGDVIAGMLHWLYLKSTFGDDAPCRIEENVISKNAQLLLRCDTALGVACLLRGGASVAPRPSEFALSAALYALLIRHNRRALRDSVFHVSPVSMAKRSLSEESDRMTDTRAAIARYVDKLIAIAECGELRTRGLTVNAQMFGAEPEYRRECVYRLARTLDKEHLELAYKLAVKYKLPLSDFWAEHLRHSLAQGNMAACLPSDVMLADLRSDVDASLDSLRQTVWQDISGCDHAGLLCFFTLLKAIDEKLTWDGLTVTDHIKTLKKVKATCQEVDYKLVLRRPPPEQVVEHLVGVARPETVAALGKLLRSLPPQLGLALPPAQLYRAWLPHTFFSVPASAASAKKWMQQYRQSASYFNKLSQEHLLEFVAEACFSHRAIDRIPHATRHVMILQAVDYCQQEEENEQKFTQRTSEMSWAQAGQQMARWARFLETFHSPSVQALMRAAASGDDALWRELEMSRGELGPAQTVLKRVLCAGLLRPPALLSLLQCLHGDLTLDLLLSHLAHDAATTASELEAAVSRLAQFEREGAALSEGTLTALRRRAAALALPPHAQRYLLAATQKSTVFDGEDLAKIVEYSMLLIKSAWDSDAYVDSIKESDLISEEGRRAVFEELSKSADTWDRRKVLVDIINCWPGFTTPDAKQSLLSFVKALIMDRDAQKENLILLKELLRKPVLDGEEAVRLADACCAAGAESAVWLLLRAHSESAAAHIPALLLNVTHDFDVEDDLIKELLDHGLFIKLVPTCIYGKIINFIISNETESDTYTTDWAVKELLNAGHIAEAGHLKLLTLGVSRALRNFSEAVQYFKHK